MNKPLPLGFHQVPVKINHRENGMFIPHEEVANGKFEGEDVVIDRNINGKLLMIMIGDRHYVVDVVDIVQGIIDFEKEEK